MARMLFLRDIQVDVQLRCCACGHQPDELGPGNLHPARCRLARDRGDDLVQR